MMFRQKEISNMNQEKKYVRTETTQQLTSFGGDAIFSNNCEAAVIKRKKTLNSVSNSSFFL